MAEAQKTWIDTATYHDLLRKLRFAPTGDPFFAGETGRYYMEVMARRKAEVGPEAHTAASKAIGWER